MATGFRLLPAGLEEAQFKRVPEGWLFTTASPWVFAPRRTYLVSEAQKPAIAARVRRGRVIRLILLVPMLLLLAAAFVMVPSLLNFRSVEIWLVLGAFVVVLTTAITVSDYLTVRPLLRDIPRSSQKIRLSDMLGRQGEAMSVRALVILTLIFVIGVAANVFLALTSVRGNPFAAIAAVALALSAIAFGGMLVGKLRARPMGAESEPTIEHLAARLNRMERASNVVALGLVGLVVLAAIAGGMLAYLFDQSSNALVQSFALRNAKGDIVARLTVGSDDLPVLLLNDGDKKTRAAVGLRSIGLRSNGTPFMSLYDANGKSRWLATVGEGNQGPRLDLLDVNGKIRWSANVNDVSDVARGSDLRLSNADGSVGWFARVTDRGSELRLSDAKGKIRWLVSVDDGGAHVRTFDAAGMELPTQK
jgi:hypothetical protein